MRLIGHETKERSVLHPLSSLKSDGCARVCEPSEDYGLRLQHNSSNECTSLQNERNLKQNHLKETLLFTAKPF